MPRIPPKTRAAFDILDGLLFNQTWFLRLSEEDETLHEGSPRAEELIALAKLKQCVDEELVATGLTGVAAHALAHTVYCILEASFGDDLVQKGLSGQADRFGLKDERGVPLSQRFEALDPAQAASHQAYERDFFMALIAAIGEQAHGVCKDTALDVAARVGAVFSEAPTAVKYRLAERVFALEFMAAPVKFLSWMYRIGVLRSKKFAPGRIKREISAEFKARVGLLCEFTLMRDFMARMPGKSTARAKSIRRLQDERGDMLSDAAWTQLQEESDFYARLERRKTRQSGTLTFNLERLEDEAYLHDFLERFAEGHWRSRFWTGPQQSWVGVVGAGMIWGYHSLADPQRKITRNCNNYSKADKAQAQEETVAQQVCQNLNEHGLDCKPGSLYEAYLERYMKKPAGLYHRVVAYHASQQALDVVFPAQVFDVTYLGTITASTP